MLGASGTGLQELPNRSDRQREEMDRYFDEHLAMIDEAFHSIANHTNGIEAFYFRVNPELTSVPKGFFYAREGVSDFREVKPTDIADYDPEKSEDVRRYYEPLKAGRPIWLSPYNSQLVGDWVVSYVVPVYKSGTFIGFIGMDLKFSTLVTQLEQFTDFKTGYLFLAGEDGSVLYHPEYEMGTDIVAVLPQLNSVAEAMRRESAARQMIRYDKGGTKWQMTYTTLTNDMKLVAAVEEAERREAHPNHRADGQCLRRGRAALHAGGDERASDQAH